MFDVVVIVSLGELTMCKCLIRIPRLVRVGRDTPIWLRFGECGGLCHLKGKCLLVRSLLSFCLRR